MKHFFICLIVLIFFLLIGPIYAKTFAASLSLDPTNVATDSGKTFTLNINIDTGTDQVKSADAYILYDQNTLQAVSVTDGTFFGAGNPVNQDLSTPGRAYISGMVVDQTQPVQGQGTIASITFKALIDGADTLKFDCTDGNTTATDILKTDGTDIIVCSANGTSSITVGTGGSTATPSATLSPGDTSVPTVTLPASLPKSGTVDNVVRFAVPGVILFIIGAGARLLL